jgi:Tfp pilus assembly protein PilN
VNAFDFLGDPRRERLAAVVASFRYGERRMLLVLACTLAACLGAVVVGLSVRSVNVTAEIERQELAHRANAPAIARYKAIAAEAASLGDIQASIVAARRSARVRAHEIVALNDRLPDGVWLSSLHVGSDAWRLAGEARDLASVSQALLAAQHDARTSAAVLESVHRPIDGGIVTYAVVVYRR